MTDPEIRNLWDEFHVPKNIRRHMEKVSEVAVRIGKKVIDKGESVDLKLLRQAALVHDLSKVVGGFDSFSMEKFMDSVKIEDLEVWDRLAQHYRGMSDPEITTFVLRNRGEGELAEIVRKHHFTSVVEPGNEPKTLPEKILYYADKLVMHDKEVTLQKRLKDLDKRYSPDGNIPEHIKEAKKRARAIERELKKKLE